MRDYNNVQSVIIVNSSSFKIKKSLTQSKIISHLQYAQEGLNINNQQTKYINSTGIVLDLSFKF